jgi:hypothetical protein
VALDVDAAAAGPAGELGVLPRRDVDVASPFHLVSFSSTTERPGMLMPSDRVSVAKTALTSPAVNSSSTTSLKVGSMPAWWAAMPRCRPSSHSQ